MTEEVNEVHKLYDEMAQTVVNGELEHALELAKSAVDQDLNLVEVIENGFSKGIEKVGVLWEEGEYFLPELMRGAEVMKTAMDVLMPHIAKDQKSQTRLGRIIIGTVAGDIPDIGKTIIATMLMANGFEVEDLGADVPLESFVKKTKEENVDIICLSALLTTTMAGQKTIIEMLRDEGVRESVKVVVGGAPVNEDWAKEIGADGYGENAIAAVSIVKELLNR